MKTIRKNIKLRKNSYRDLLLINGENILEKALFLDLEHYIYIKPKAIGIFGAGFIEDGIFHSYQIILEKSGDIHPITEISVGLLKEMKEKGKEYLITFSGNNDIMVMDYMAEKFRLDFRCLDNFTHIDIQKEIEKKFTISMGLKPLEKLMGIKRENEAITGSGISRVFQKIIKDPGYIKRMPEGKMDNLILYNMLDYYNLYHIMARWNRLSKRKIENYRKERLSEAEERKKVREETVLNQAVNNNPVNSQEKTYKDNSRRRTANRNNDKKRRKEKSYTGTQPGSDKKGPYHGGNKNITE